MEKQSWSSVFTVKYDIVKLRTDACKGSVHGVVMTINTYHMIANILKKLKGCAFCMYVCVNQTLSTFRVGYKQKFHY